MSEASPQKESIGTASVIDKDMFRAPVHRGLKHLDKALFRVEAVVPAATVPNVKNLHRIRATLDKSRDVFRQGNLRPVVDDTAGRKSILLRPTINATDPNTWPPIIRELVDQGDIALRPYHVTIDYDSWTTKEILQSILPEDLQEEIPVSFAVAGHIAHLNLRPEYLPYKSIIAEVILTVPGIRTVINKTQTLDEENQFRVLDYELLAGEDDMNAEVRRRDCIFRFDYSKVFWNTKLSTEHDRLLDTFSAGEAVCDVMAGVGPFALPAGKKGVFVWANDLNPDCYECLVKGVAMNKLTTWVQSFNEDGHTFIRSAAKELLKSTHYGRSPIKMTRTQAKEMGINPKDLFSTVKQPRTFSHYVMNLPSTAMDFLPSFIGLYAGHEAVFKGTGVKLPMIHCYCFEFTGDDDDIRIRKSICARISEKIGFKVNYDDEDVTIWDVRNVAPSKSQFCASFRLPAQVAFRTS